MYFNYTMLWVIFTEMLRVSSMKYRGDPSVIKHLLSTNKIKDLWVFPIIITESTRYILSHKKECVVIIVGNNEMMLQMLNFCA